MTEETKTLQDNESLIAEQLRDAKLVDVPSELKREPILHRGDDELDAPMTVKELTSAGYVYVWDSRSFRRAPVLYYMLAHILRQKRDDGSYRWTTNDPKKRPQMGRMKCRLHKDDPNRKEYDGMGLRVCKKSNIINEFEVKMHMQKKHPKEWQAIEDKRKETERQEDRAHQRALYEAVSAKATNEKTTGTEKAPLYVSDKDKVKVEK